MGVPSRLPPPPPVAADGAVLRPGARVRCWRRAFAAELRLPASLPGTVRAAHGSTHLVRVVFDGGYARLVDRFKLRRERRRLP